MRTIRTYLLLLTMVAAVPPVLFAAFVLQRLATSEVDSFGRNVIEVARAIDLSIDGRVGEQMAALETLGASPALLADDLGAFRAEMVNAALLLQSAVTLSDADGRMLLSTQRAADEPLPRRNGARFAAQAARDGRATVSDLYVGAVSGRWVATIESPVRAEGRIRYVLTATVDPASIASLLTRQRLPAEWMTSVIDRDGRFIARSRQHEARVGTQSSPMFTASAAARPEGWIRTTSVEGSDNYVGFSRSELTGWSVGIGVPVQIVWGPLWRALIPLGVAGAALVAVSLILALRIGWRIEDPIIAVARLASAKTGAGEPPDLGLREANEVALALAAARADERATARSLEASEARYRALAEAQPSIMFVADPDGRNTYANRAFQEYTGLPDDALLGDGWLRVIHPDDRDRAAAAWSASVRDLTPYEIEYRFRAAAGSYRWFLGRGVPAVGPGGEVTAWFGTATDIGDLVAARETLARRGGDLEAQVVARTAERDRTWLLSRDLLSVLDRRGRFVSVNPAFTATLGHAEETFLGAAFIDFVHPDDQAFTTAEQVRARDGESIDSSENRLRHADGGYRTLSWTTRTQDGLTYCVARDVTAQRATEAALRAAEDQARQTQKLEAVGQLTGGVAHDFNNLLQVVSANLELLRPALEQAGDAARRRHAAAFDAVRRGAALTRQLLAFARKQPLEPQIVDPARLLRDQGELLRRTLGETVEVEVTAAEDVWPVFADPNQLENAILNLAVNARDAIMSAGAEATGRLRLAAENVTIAARRAESEAEPGDYVRISVADTGPGMPKEVMARAFEPFFTTKPDGQGTGLGLAQVYGFTRQSGGHVELDSEPGEGTVVRLHLARSTHAAEPEPARPAAEAPAAPRGTETVLVVEDDPEVQAASVETLDSLGYRTLRAFDGASALAVMQAGVRVDLLFTDVVMPGPVSSVDLSARARALQPGVAVLFTSGYAESSIVHHGRLDPGVALISKPYGRDELARKVRSVLDAPRGAPSQAARPRPGPAATREGAPAASSRTILLVEDDELIRLSAAMLLEGAGHAVVEAGTGAQALAMLASESGIEVLMTDLGLPDLNGAELVLRARAMRPELAVIVATGREADSSAVSGAIQLQKPYDLRQMRAALAQAVSGAGAGAGAAAT